MAAGERLPAIAYETGLMTTARSMKGDGPQASRPRGGRTTLHTGALCREE